MPRTVSTEQRPAGTDYAWAGLVPLSPARLFLSSDGRAGTGVLRNLLTYGSVLPETLSATTCRRRCFCLGTTGRLRTADTLPGDFSLPWGTPVELTCLPTISARLRAIPSGIILVEFGSTT